jgi:hypothetical protein
MPVDGLGIAYVTGGFLLIYSGYRNVGIKAELTSFLRGQVPQGSPTGAVSVGLSTVPTVPVNQTTQADTQIGQASGGTKVSGANTSIENYGLAQLVAGTYGWAGGTQFAALTNVINAESGGDPNATNAQSGAYGIAQALGHGTSNTQGTVTNQYGGYGVPDATARAANSGNASAQLVWMMAYIKATYGDPVNAWAHEQSYHWY